MKGRERMGRKRCWKGELERWVVEDIGGFEGMVRLERDGRFWWEREMGVKERDGRVGNRDWEV